MKDLWGGMFDFNGDDVMDIGEEYLAYKIYEAVTEALCYLKKLKKTKRYNIYHAMANRFIF